MRTRPAADDRGGGRDPEAGEPERGDGRPQAQLLLREEEEERGQRGVAEHPEDLRGEEAADARAGGDAQVVAGAAGGALGPRSRHVGGRVARLDHRREREQRHEHGGERERRPDGDVGQRAADRDADEAADEQRELLRARRARPALGREALGDERAVDGRDGVQADVDDGAGRGEEDVRRARAERDGGEPAAGDQRRRRG